MGGPRRDFYTSMIAMSAGGPYEKRVSTADFAMPWSPPPEEADDDDDWDGR